MANGPADLSGIKALTFDVFGTVVDWRGSIIRYGAELESGLSPGSDKSIDWPMFADAWRAAYGPGMDRVRRGDLPWTNLDDLHRISLERLVPVFGLDRLDQDQMARLNCIWHRLEPWPDAVRGVARLSRRYTVATLSNGNVALLTNMAKKAGLRWDVVLSAELFRHYKPDAAIYTGAAELLGLLPGEVMMVAAHADDLEAARSAGLRTAYVHRPLEHGPSRSTQAPLDACFDLYAFDLGELASKLGMPLSSN